MPKRSIDWKSAFLLALEKTGSITESAKVAGVDRATPYHVRTTNPQFARQWDEAVDRAADLLEDEARKRAFSGSDLLLIFLLKGIRPQKWRESRATIPPAELNKMIEAELERIARQKEAEVLEPVN